MVADGRCERRLVVGRFPGGGGSWLCFTHPVVRCQMLAGICRSVCSSEWTLSSRWWQEGRRPTQHTTQTRSVLLLQLTHYSPPSPSPHVLFVCGRQAMCGGSDKCCYYVHDRDQSCSLSNAVSPSIINNVIVIRSWSRQAVLLVYYHGCMHGQHASRIVLTMVEA